ncbi:MAG: PAS domain-containing protein, partial [Gemmatimonadetes bacterium]|nr:PAS domain-containing protein [Gemmatimonadota bacterium]
MASSAVIPPGAGNEGLVFERLIGLSSEAMLVCAPDGRILRSNWAFTHVLGWTEEAARGRQVRDLVHPQDMEGLRAHWRGRGAADAAVEHECRWAHAAGGWVWLAWSAYMDPELGVILAVGRDISRRRHAELMDRGQRTVLEAIGSGQPLPAILDALVRFVEREAPGAMCTVLTLDTDGRRVHVAAAPNAPAALNAAIEGEEIGPQAGSCGTAIFRRERVIVTDIAHD